MKKENLRKSLDTALMYQNLIEVFRNVVRDELTNNDDINDGLTIVMMVGHNGLGNILIKLQDVIETIQERIDIFGDGDGFPKQTKASFEQDGEEFVDHEPLEEWELDDDD